MRVRWASGRRRARRTLRAAAPVLLAAALLIPAGTGHATDAAPAPPSPAGHAPAHPLLHPPHRAGNGNGPHRRPHADRQHPLRAPSLVSDARTTVPSPVPSATTASPPVTPVTDRQPPTTAPDEPHVMRLLPLGVGMTLLGLGLGFLGLRLRRG